MKRFTGLLLITIFALSLTACANKAGGDAVRVKCPSCGFEFDVQDPGGQ